MNLTVNEPKECPTCGGDGELVTTHRFRCYTCDGSGKVSDMAKYVIAQEAEKQMMRNIADGVSAAEYRGMVNMIQVIHGEIWSNDFSELDQLIRDFQSCVRFTYCRFSKDNLDFNDVRRIAKIKYLMLNSAQVADAVLQGQTSKNVLLAQQEALAETKIEIEDKLKKKLSSKKKIKLQERLKRVNYRLEHPKLVFGGRKT